MSRLAKQNEQVGTTVIEADVNVGSSNLSS